MIWALELMENKYRQLRQHMKFNLPGTTKAILDHPIDTLDQMGYGSSYFTTEECHGKEA